MPIYGKLDSTSLVKLYMLRGRGRKGKSLRNRWKKPCWGDTLTGLEDEGMKETRENFISLGRCIRNYYTIFRLKEKVNMDLITSGKMTLANLFKLEYIGAFSYTPKV